ncbi:MAG: helix-turn-helix domain-containing protein [Streptosporangiales bacterium]|nr:helix-turn-helix domain-containing protein [Streptosporangiales bacterium]
MSTAAGVTRIWRADDLGGVELLRATITEFAFRPHAHEEFFVALTERGVATPTYRGDRHVLAPGDVLVLNPEEAHAGGPPGEQSWSYRAVYLDPALLRGFAAGQLPHFGDDLVRDPEIVRGLRRFHRLAESPRSSRLQREQTLTATLALLTSRYARPGPELREPGREPAAIRAGREYLDEHAADSVTLQAVARQVGLSAYHFCRAFRSAVGMTPHAYQTHIRIRRAKTLLDAGHPIADVAARTGFYDQAHLTRQFTRAIGVPPGRYRLRT